MVQVFIPDGDGVKSLIHIAHVAKNWYEEHEKELEHIVATTISISQYYWAFVVDLEPTS